MRDGKPNQIGIEDPSSFLILMGRDMTSYPTFFEAKYVPQIGMLLFNVL